MSSVDSRIVTMKFDNAEFQKGVSTTMSTLDKLKASLSFSSVAKAATQPLGLMATALSKIGLSNPFAKTKQGLDEVNTGTTSAAKGLSGISGTLSKFGISNPFSKTKQGLDEVNTGTTSATKGLSGISGVLSKFGISNPFSKTTQGLGDLNTGTSSATKGLSGISGVLGKFGISNPFSKTTTGLSDLNTGTTNATKGLSGISGVLGKFGISNPFSKTTTGLSDLNTGTVNAQKGLSGISGTLSKFGTTNVFANSTDGVANLQSETNKFTLAPITGGVTSVSSSFLAMATVGITALSNVTTAALNAGTQLVKSLTIDPISAGLSEYETNLNSIQTILANTGLKGDEGLAKVNDSLNELNTYSDKTIYNFSQMAKNIGTFTAAGVDLDTSTAAIKGIANLAAVSGSNADQASTAMYQLSQALASGKLTLMDWNSVVNAGMGGKVFQESLKETARVHGVAIDDMIKDAGGFRASLEQGWITGDVLTETLGKFTGDLNAAQLKNMGYNQQQIKGILEMGKTATDAATKVKTMSGLIGTLQETVGSGWGKSFALLFGNFNEAKTLFTGVNNVLGGMLSSSANARNKVLGDWNELGGRTVLIDAISNAFHALMNILTPIGKAFRDIFPATTGKGLYDLTVMLRDFTAGLIASKGTMDAIRGTFQGLFAILGIGWEVVKGLAGFIFQLIGIVATGEAPILTLTSSVGGVIKAFHDWLIAGDYIGKFFDGLISVIGPVVAALFTIRNVIVGVVLGGLKLLWDVLASLAPPIDVIISRFNDMKDAFSAFVSSGVADFIDRLRGYFQQMQPYIDLVRESLANAVDAVREFFGGIDYAGLLNAFVSLVSSGVDTFIDRLRGYFEQLQPNIDKVRESLSNAVTAVRNFFGGIDYSALLGAFVALVSSGIDTFINKLRGYFEQLQPYIDVVRESLVNAYDAVRNFFSGVDYSGLLNAFGILDGLAKVFDISTVTDTAKKGVDGVTSSLEAAGPAATAAKEEVSKYVDLLKNIGRFLGGMGQAIGSALSEIFTGVTGTVGGLWSGISAIFSSIKERIIGFFKDLGFTEALSLVNTGFFIALYSMLRIFIGKFGKVLESIQGSFEAFTGVLNQLTSNLKTMQADVRSNIIMKIAISLGLLAAAVYVLSKIDAKKLGKALGAVAIMIGELVGALVLLEKSSSFKGAAEMAILSVALLGLGIALLALSVAIAILGNMDIRTLATGIGSMAAVLAVVIASAAILGKTGGGGQMILAAASILILAVAMTALAGAIKLYSALDLLMLAEGMGKIAAALIVIGIAMRAMPKTMLASAAGMFILANALVILAGALKIMGGLSIEEIAKSLITLDFALGTIALALNAMTGTVKGSAALLVFVGALTLLVPVLIILGNLPIEVIAKALLVLVGVFLVIGGAAAILQPLVPVLLSLAGAIGLLGLAIFGIGTGMLAFATGLALLAASGSAGLLVLTAAIVSTAALIPLVMEQIGLGIVAFAKVISEAGPVMIEAFTAVLLSIIDSIIKTAPKVGTAFRVIIAEILKTVRSAVPDMIKTAFVIIDAFLGGLSKNIQDIAAAGAKIIAEYLRGIGRNIDQVISAGVELVGKIVVGIAKAIGKMTPAAGGMVGRFLQGIASNLGKLVVSGVTMVGKFLVGILRSIGKLTAAGVSMIGKFLQGIVSNLPKIISSAVTMVGKFLSGIGKSIGKMIPAAGAMLGKFIQGIVMNLPKILNSGVTTVGKFLSGIGNTIGKLVGAGVSMVGKFLSGIANSIGRLIPAAASMIGSFLSGIASNIGRLVPAAASAIGSFLSGIASNIGRLVPAAASMIGSFLSGIASNIGKLVGAAASVVGSFISGIQENLGRIATAAGAFISSLLTGLGQSLSGLVQAGKDLAWGIIEGLIAGLKAGAQWVKDEASNMASNALAGAKAALHIGSPSKEFAKIGMWSSMGMADGIRKYSPVVNKSADEMGKSALNTLKTTMSGMSDTLSGEVKMNPVIAPVLDLSQVQKDATKIGTMLGGQSLAAGVSYAQASGISAEQLAAAQAKVDAAYSEAAPITFEQNNYSPKSLSPVEIYRNTKNQLSLAKEALNV